MAWYKTGTVAVTNASTTVTGTGTNFVSGAQVGDGFLGPNELLYEITAINSATSLTIAPAYGGATASSQNYAIAPTQGLVASLASDVTDLITDYQSVVDNVGAGKFGDGSAASPAIRFTNDQDTGFFRDTANEIAFATAGVKRGEFTSSGLIVAGNISANRTAGYGALEVGGPSGGLIDLKAPASDDYDARIIYTDGVNLQISTLAANEPILLRQGNVTRLETTSTGASITGSLGIGTSSPAYNLVVEAASPRLQLLATGTNTGTSGILFGDADTATRGQINYNHANEDLTFIVNGQSRLNLNSLSLDVTGRVKATGYVEASLGSGGIALTHNDGYGNANIAFNHTSGTPEQDGSSARIASAVDGNSAQMDFQLKSNVTSGTAVAAVSKLTLTDTAATFADDLVVASGGIYLGGTGSANYLDDYEEGTFTPSVSSGTINSSGGTYTKIGRVVHCAVVFHSVSDTSSGSAFGISGLPFDADPNGYAWGSSMWRNNGSGQHICYITDSNQVRFYHGSTSGAYSSLTHSQLTSGAGAHIFFTYTTPA
jgi:hypothetical protein